MQRKLQTVAFLGKLSRFSRWAPKARANAQPSGKCGFTGRIARHRYLVADVEEAGKCYSGVGSVLRPPRGNLRQAAKFSRCSAVLSTAAAVVRSPRVKYAEVRALDPPGRTSGPGQARRDSGKCGSRQGGRAPGTAATASLVLSLHRGVSPGKALAS